MDPEHLGATVRLRRVASVAEWEAIDTRLAGYSGVVRVFGFKAGHDDESHSLAAYRLDGQRGSPESLTSIIKGHVIIRAPNWYDETLFVFQYAREAQLFRLRNLDYVIDEGA